MIPKVKIKLTSPVGHYEEFELDEDKLIWLFTLISQGDKQQAIDVFAEDYIELPSSKYQDVMQFYLEESTRGELEEEDRNNLVRNIALLSFGLSALLMKNYSKFVRGPYAGFVFNEIGLDNKDVQKAVIDNVISHYNQLIEGAMSGTSSFLINGVREIQREIIVENARLKFLGLKGPSLDEEIQRFKRALKAKYPKVYQAMSEGNILFAKRGVDSPGKHYKLDYYADMSIRSAILNVDRTTATTTAILNGEPVVEYYLSDPRFVKKERDICQEILARTIMGKSLLAIEQRAADILGIMTVDEAMTTPDYAMGPNCRHAMRRLDSAYLKELYKTLRPHGN
jgi:hypothetical protein